MPRDKLANKEIKMKDVIMNEIMHIIYTTLMAKKIIIVINIKITQ